MNPIADFFRRHGAVPATDAGPTWSQADDATLVGRFNQVSPIVRWGWNREAARDATELERRGLLAEYEEIVAELARRIEWPDVSPMIMGAYVASCCPGGPQQEGREAN